MLGFSGDRDEGLGPGIGSGAGIGEGFGPAGTTHGSGSLSGGGGTLSSNITDYDGSNAVSVTAGQMAGGMAGGPMSEGGGEPLIMRLQGLTPAQQNFLLNDPQALRVFNQEYDRIIQSGQGGQIGVGWSNDDSYTHGQYRVPPSGLISQGTTNDFFGGM